MHKTHRPNKEDNLSKAKALCHCTVENPQLMRVELIRKFTDATSGEFFKKLNMKKSGTRTEVEKALTNENLTTFLSPAESEGFSKSLFSIFFKKLSFLSLF